MSLAAIFDPRRPTARERIESAIIEHTPADVKLLEAAAKYHAAGVAHARATTEAADAMREVNRLDRLEGEALQRLDAARDELHRAAEATVEP